MTLADSKRSEARSVSGIIPETNGLKATIGGMGLTLTSWIGRGVVYGQYY